MDDECLRTFQTAGLVEQVLPHTVPNQRLIFLNGEKKVLAEIAPRTDEYGWPRRNGFVQPLADQVSLRRPRALPARRGALRHPDERAAPGRPRA